MVVLGGEHILAEIDRRTQLVPMFWQALLIFRLRTLARTCHNPIFRPLIGSKRSYLATPLV